MTNLYRPPFDPYSERQEAQDPDPALRSLWDGCWAWSLARAINATTGGKVTCIVPGKTVERVIRDAAGVPDRAGIADGGTLASQITALGKLAPAGTWYSSRPTQAEFRAHLAAGGMAVMAGWESDAPVSDRAYDPRFYDRTGANAHSILGQGVGDGKGVIWGNPEKFAGAAEPIVTIDAALKFVWDSQAGGYPRVEALLLNSFVIPEIEIEDTMKAINIDRLVDTRSGYVSAGGLPVGRLQVNVPVRVQVTGKTLDGAVVPATTKAISGSLVIVGAAAVGNASCSAKGDLPTLRRSSRINFPAMPVGSPNGALATGIPNQLLDAAGGFYVMSTAECDVVFDVDGLG